MEVGVDRISVLPEHVLHHILNFLPTEYARQISPTCKRLNEVWTTLPYLDFGKDFFPTLSQIYHEEEVNRKNIVKDELTRRINFVEQTLTRKMMLNLTIHKFQFCWTDLDDELAQNLDRWIRYLVQHCNINELALEGKGPYRRNPRYNLPHILFTATSLRALKLSCCSMPPTSVTLPALKKLILKYVSLHENMLLDIINICRYLEDLELIYCSGFKKRISLAPPRHSRLRNLALKLSILEGADEVIIEAYNLEKFCYGGFLRPATINIIANYDASLKFLCLSGVNITNTWLCELISRLCCLEELWLMQLNLKAIEISSCSLKRLSLRHVFHYRDIKFGEFKIDTPNLVSLVYSGTLSSVFQNSLAVKKVDIRCDEFKRNRTFEQLCNDMQFLHKFDHSEVVMVECTFFENMILPLKKRLKKRLNLHTPLAHIKHLILKGKFRGAPLDVLAKVFEGVRWIAPNLDCLSFKCLRQERGSHINLIKFTAGRCDCSTSPSECLKKCRSRTKIEVEGVGVEVDALRNYLYHSAGNPDDDCNPWDLQYSTAS